MAVKKRCGRWHLVFRPFKNEQIGVRLDVETKSHAQQVEAALTYACRTGNYAGLDPVARGACVRMFVNKGWQLPAALGGPKAEVGPPEPEITLWQMCEYFFRDPEIRRKREKALRGYRESIVHLVEHLGKDTLLRSLWAFQLKLYQSRRLDEGAAPSTVNTELSALSRIFGIAMELKIADTNPVRLVKRLSTKGNLREVYLSMDLVKDIAEQCPPWYQRIIWCSFYSGMRKGEILSLTRRHVNLAKRMIHLRPEDTKEGHAKRVPIHRDLVQIIEEALRVPYLSSEKVFLVQDQKGIREPGTDSVGNPWPRACDKLQNANPKEPYFKGALPRFHDLRHTWRTNARRSGMDYQIAESIMGHWFKGKSVNDRYGRISDAELLEAVDNLTFNHGETEIILSGSVPKKCEQNVNKPRVAR